MWKIKSYKIHVKDLVFLQHGRIEEKCPAVKSKYYMTHVVFGIEE
jgi:hypothetical protein